jgi:hypothetical protein
VLQEAARRPLVDGGRKRDQRLGGSVVLMGGLLLDVLGFLVVCLIVFALVAACERDRS